MGNGQKYGIQIICMLLAMGVGYYLLGFEFGTLKMTFCVGGGFLIGNLLNGNFDNK